MNNKKGTTESYVSARNSAGRPTLMHRVTGKNFTHSLCGVDMRSWTRVFFQEPIEILLCLRCKKFATLVDGMHTAATAKVIPIRNVRKSS